MGQMYHYTTHVAWETYTPAPLYNIVWPMGHGKRVAEGIPCLTKTVWERTVRGMLNYRYPGQGQYALWIAKLGEWDHLVVQ